MLAVVEHDHAWRPVGDRGDDLGEIVGSVAHVDLQRRRHRRTEVRAADTREIHGPHPARKAVDEARGELQREARLADPTGTRERDEPMLGNGPRSALELLGPSDEGRQRHREVAPQSRLGRGRAGTQIEAGIVPQDRSFELAQPRRARRRSRRRGVGGGARTRARPRPDVRCGRAQASGDTSTARAAGALRRDRSARRWPGHGAQLRGRRRGATRWRTDAAHRAAPARARRIPGRGDRSTRRLATSASAPSYSPSATSRSKRCASTASRSTSSR